MDETVKYHAVHAWIHLSELLDRESELGLDHAGKDVLLKAIMLTHVLSGGEDVREAGSEANT
jgi:hypothetical protein